MKINELRSSTLVMVAVVASVLSACGGGGGGATSPVTTTVDISGVASKGLIKRGKVSVYEIGVNGTKINTAITTTKTDDIGAYTLKGVPAGTPVLIEVTPDVDTQVIDENTGNAYTPANDFMLRAAINTVAGSTNTNTAIVTPYSEMAVTRAQALTGGLKSSNIDLANQYVGDSTGVIVNNVDSSPKFDSDGKTPLNSTAAKLVAIAKMTSTNDSSVDVCKGKNILSDKTKCVVDELSKAAIIGIDSSSGLGKILNDKLVEVKAANSNKTAVANTPGIKTATSTASNTATGDQSPVGQVKAFFASLRSNAKALKDSSNGTAPTLYTKLQDIQTDLQTRATPLNNYASNTITLITKAHGLLQDAQSGSGVYRKSWYKGSYTFSGTNYYWGLIGSCSVYTANDLMTEATSIGSAKVVACTTTGNQDDVYNFITPVTTNGQTKFTRTETVTGITLAPKSNAVNSYNVSSRTFRRTVVATVPLDSYPSEHDYVELDKNARTYLSAADLASGSEYLANVVLTKDSANNITAITWSGDMASSYNNAGVVLGKKQVLNLNAQLDTINSNTKKLSMAGDISLIDTSDQLINKLSLDTGSYVIASDNQNGQDEVLLKLSLTSPKGVIQGSLKGTQFIKDKNGLNYAPTQFEFIGSVKDSSGAEFFSGSITGSVSNYASVDKSQPDSATNFTPITVRIIGAASILNRPHLSVDFSISETAFESGTGTLLYTQGNDPSITITASHTAGSKIKSYTFANTQGIGMRWTSADTTASMMKNDVPLGTWDFSSGRLTFIDGTFEQF